MGLQQPGTVSSTALVGVGMSSISPLQSLSRQGSIAVEGQGCVQKGSGAPPHLIPWYAFRRHSRSQLPVCMRAIIMARSFASEPEFTKYTFCACAVWVGRCGH